MMRPGLIEHPRKRKFDRKQYSTRGLYYVQKQVQGQRGGLPDDHLAKRSNPLIAGRGSRLQAQTMFPIDLLPASSSFISSGVICRQVTRGNKHGSGQNHGHLQLKLSVADLSQRSYSSQRAAVDYFQRSPLLGLADQRCPGDQHWRATKGVTLNY